MAKLPDLLVTFREVKEKKDRVNYHDLSLLPGGTCLLPEGVFIGNQGTAPLYIGANKHGITVATKKIKAKKEKKR